MIKYVKHARGDGGEPWDSLSANRIQVVLPSVDEEVESIIKMGQDMGFDMTNCAMNKDEVIKKTRAKQLSQ